MKSSCSAPGAGRHWSIIAAAARRRAAASSGADAHVAGALVGVLERLGQQRVARIEVVVDERRRHARVRRDAGDAHLVDPFAGDPPHRRVEDPCPRARAGRRSLHATRLDASEHDAPGERARGVRRRGADPARGEGRARRRAAARRGRRARSGARRSTRGLSGGLHSRRARRPGLDATSSGSLSRSSSGARRTRSRWHIPTAYNVLAHGTPEQIDRYLQPGAARRAARRLRRHRGARRLRPVGHRDDRDAATDGGWRIDGEKWFVTYGDVAAVFIVMASAGRRRRRLPTLFLVDARPPGIAVVDDPPFTHNYPHGHPTLRFDASRSATTR